MKKILLLAGALLSFGCASEPSLQTGPDAEYTFDGLVRIDNARFSRAWIDPDVDLKRYNKIMLADAEFEFRAVKNAPRATISTTNTREFYISDANKQKLIDTVTAVFAEELQKSKSFTITDTADAETLLIVGGLLDIVSRVPPDQIGAGGIYLSSLGEATLVLEARDALSGETLYRATDRRRVEPVGREMMLSNSVTNYTEVRRWAKRWASRLREGLDSIHE
jgi:hypothetical protein